MEVERKFIQSFDVSDYEILTDTGWKDVKAIHKTVKYDVWILRTENHVLECADDHIVFDEDWNEVFVKNLNPGQMILTDDGLEKVVEVVKTDRIENMYDVELPEYTNHRYYTNGILSHNTTIYTVYLLWYAMYHPDKRVMICGNKLSIAIEIMDRIRLGYEYCPSSIKIGVKTYNKSCIEFENNSIIRCFATGSSGCRGFSANCVNKYSIIKVRLFGWLKLKLPIFMLRWFGYEQNKERNIKEGRGNEQGLAKSDNRDVSVQLFKDDKDEQIICFVD